MRHPRSALPPIFEYHPSVRMHVMTSPNSTPHRLTRRLAMAGVSILAAAVLAACSGGHAEEAGMPPPPQVSAAPVLIKPVSQWDDFSGRVEAVQSVELRPRVSGYIDKVNYVEGEEVKKGDVLFTIDARSYQAEYDRARAELARARTQSTLARSESERAKKLSDQQAISTETWEQRRAAADRAPRLHKQGDDAAGHRCQQAATVIVAAVGFGDRVVDVEALLLVATEHIQRIAFADCLAAQQAFAELQGVAVVVSLADKLDQRIADPYLPAFGCVADL